MKFHELRYGQVFSMPDAEGYKKYIFWEKRTEFQALFCGFSADASISESKACMEYEGKMISVLRDQKVRESY